MSQSVEKIVLPKDIAEKAIGHFEQNLPNESAVFIFGKVHGRTAIATDILIPDGNDYVARSPSYCEVSYKFLARNIHQFWSEGKDLILSWHAHPIEGLSHTDIGNHETLVEIFPNHLSGFYNHGSFNFYKKSDGDITSVSSKIVDMKRYDRQMSIFGERQLLLASTTVALVGCGGGNSEVARMLAEKGIGRLILIDPDGWDETSLNRAWVPSSHVGRNKAESLKGVLESFRPEIEIEAYPLDVRKVSEEILKEADIFITFTDTITSRLYGNELALKMKRPAIFAASEIRTDSQHKLECMVGDCLVYVPDKTPCYRCNLPIDHDKLRRETEDPETWKQYANRYGLPLEFPPQPSVVELNSMIASLVADEATKLVTGYAEPIHHQYLDFLCRKLMILKAEKNLECPACMKVPDVQVRPEDIVTEKEALESKQ